jgi:hypothetical protein
MPDPSVGSGLKVKNKTIRVLLDSGSSDDLLFIKKGSRKQISVVKRVFPQSWGTSNGTFFTDRVGNIEISFVEYSASKKVRLQPDIVEYIRCIFFLETHLSIKQSHRILTYNRRNILFLSMLYFVA